VNITRFDENPLVTPVDVKPSREDFEVVCAFNAGAIRVNDEILLLLRVAERPKHGPDEVLGPHLNLADASEGMQILRVKRDDPDLEMPDSRVFKYKGIWYLTSISHLRVARSKDGRNFTVDESPSLLPNCQEEELGIEDPRITKLGDEYYINYSSISTKGVLTGLAVTRDFRSFERKGIIFPPDNRDVTIFPEKIGGRYACYHRPLASMFERGDMWYATSPDMVHWGGHRFAFGPQAGSWDAWRVGGGAVPFKTKDGWLEIYHAADADQRYCLGAFLADGEKPYKIIGHCSEPILSPDAPYEREGFFGNVVFTCGAVVEDDGRVLIYYGAADERIAGAETSVDDLLGAVK
jgi:predicted GH43/DUF377 family glycosyl hydrolase